VLFAAVVMLGEPCLDVLSALLDFVDTPQRDGVEDEALAGIRETLRIRHALPAREGRRVLPNKLPEWDAGPDRIGTAALQCRIPAPVLWVFTVFVLVTLLRDVEPKLIGQKFSVDAIPAAIRVRRAPNAAIHVFQEG